MLKSFPIDFIRQTLEQKLFEEHIKDPNLFGGKKQVAIKSFYEQLKSQTEVDRFVETYRDLTEQQNRSGLLLNGVLLSPDNPTITNLYSSLIIPMTWTCSLRTMLVDRDASIVTINNLIEKLKGKKVDIAQLECVDEEGRLFHTPFVVGTLAQQYGDNEIKNTDYIGEIESLFDVNTIFDDLMYGHDMLVYKDEDLYLYVAYENKLAAIKCEPTHGDINIATTTITEINYVTKHFVVKGLQLNGQYYLQKIHTPINLTIAITGSLGSSGSVDVVANKITGYEYGTTHTKINIETHNVNLNNILEEGETVASISLSSATAYTQEYDIDFFDDELNNYIEIPPEHNSFEKYKLSMSFDSIRCDEPRNLNANEYCDITFGGSATLVSEGVRLGNDLLKISITKSKIEAETPITYTNPTTYWLEPLEMPSGSNANTQINQLVSNNFLTNSHTDGIALTLQYTFICDFSNDFLKQLFDYARFGTRGTSATQISPNMIYDVCEVWSSWGVLETHHIPTKITENIDIENTESDTLTIGVTMQIQGEN